MRGGGGTTSGGGGQDGGPGVGGTHLSSPSRTAKWRGLKGEDGAGPGRNSFIGGGRRGLFGAGVSVGSGVGCGGGGGGSSGVACAGSSSPAGVRRWRPVSFVFGKPDCRSLRLRALLWCWGCKSREGGGKACSSFRFATVLAPIHRWSRQTS